MGKPTLTESKSHRKGITFISQKQHLSDCEILNFTDGDCCSQGTTAVWLLSLSYIAVLASTWSSPTSPPSSSSSSPGSASGWTWSTSLVGWLWASPPSSPSPASQQVSARRHHKGRHKKYYMFFNGNLPLLTKESYFPS